MPYMFNAVSGGVFVLYHHHDPLFGCNVRENHRPLYNGIRLYFRLRESCITHLLLDLREALVIVDLAIT